MGSANLEPETGYATVFSLRIQKAADAWAMPASEIMGNVIAHELGHLLLRSASHSFAGVMTARWDSMTRMRDLLFNRRQAGAMQGQIMSRARKPASADVLARQRSTIPRSAILAEVE